jgi:hypothetical protein
MISMRVLLSDGWQAAPRPGLMALQEDASFVAGCLWDFCRKVGNDRRMRQFLDTPLEMTIV